MSDLILDKANAENDLLNATSMYHQFIEQANELREKLAKKKAMLKNIIAIETDRLLKSGISATAADKLVFKDIEVFQVYSDCLHTEALCRNKDSLAQYWKDAGDNKKAILKINFGYNPNM